MSRREPTDLVASVRQRLLDRSRERNEDYQLVLTRFGIERWLFRLSKSPHAGTFVLKGALLFALWMNRPYRPTRDLDLLAEGDLSAERLAEIIRQVCGTRAPPDGLVFDADSVRIEEIREAQPYQGLRARFQATLGSARISLQIDVGFGDVVTPAPGRETYPTLLATLPAPVLRAYPRETVVAEKLEAMVRLGMVNSRLKDFYDVWILSRHWRFDGRALGRAVQATFARRRTVVPSQTPLGLSDAFAREAQKAGQYRGFLGRHGLEADAPDLAGLVADLRSFLLPPLNAAARQGSFEAAWQPGGPWLPAAG